MTTKAASEPYSGLSAPMPTPTPPLGVIGSGVVLLADGRSVSSSGIEWLVECRDRELETRAIMRILDRDNRRSYLASYVSRMTVFARDNLPDPDPAAFGAECGRRLTAVVLERWEQARSRITGA